MIEFNKYTSLDEVTQACLLWQHATFIDSRSHARSHISLFQMNGFYIEVFFSPCFGRILKVVAFQDSRRLQPYLKQINLIALLN